MTMPLAYNPPRRRAIWLPGRQQIPFFATVIVCVLLYFIAGHFYPSFFKPIVRVNLINDNAHLGIVAIGSTFVILAGGIDLSVGSIVGCTGIALAVLITREHVNPVLAIAIVLAAGLFAGAIMGGLIHLFRLEPFLVTLAGLFFFRGLALVISPESIEIDHPIYDWLGSIAVPFGPHVSMPLPGLVFLALLIVCIYVSLYTRIGRNIYAVGGSESSAILMGLPVGRTIVLIYAFSGFCSALGGVMLTIYMGSGNAIAATGMELDAIAAVVVGGTLLTGGVGYIAGTFAGVMIFGMIQLAIIFDGRLSSWWTKIAVGGLLLAFILLQKILQFGKGSRS